MSDTPVQDNLYNNLANGRQSPFRDLPHNEMMLITDRRAQLFLHRVVSALSPGESQMAALDSDLTPLHFWGITQDAKRQ